jgi:lysozyme family protein
MIAVEVPTFFAPIFRLTLLVERGGTDGRVDDPDDRGGRTKDGVTQATFDAFNSEYHRARRDVWGMTDEEAVEIYFLNYWLRGRCDMIDDRTDSPERIVAPRLALAHYDACVNHGIRGVSKRTGKPYGAAVMFQEVVGATPIDGWIGKQTLAALDARLGISSAACGGGHPAAVLRQRETLLVEAYLARRESLYRALAKSGNQAKFLAGWLNRLAILRRHLARM